MKLCNTCKSKYDDRVAFCFNDGSVLVGDDKAQGAGELEDIEDAPTVAVAFWGGPEFILEVLELLPVQGKKRKKKRRSSPTQGVEEGTAPAQRPAGRPLWLLPLIAGLAFLMTGAAVLVIAILLTADLGL